MTEDNTYPVVQNILKSFDILLGYTAFSVLYRCQMVLKMLLGMDRTWNSNNSRAAVDSKYYQRVNKISWLDSLGLT